MSTSPQGAGAPAPTPRPRGRRGIKLKTPSPVNFERVATAARGRWFEILSALSIDPKVLRDLHQPCPGCGGRDRFRFDDKEGRGTFVCSGGGNDILVGDGFALLGHVFGWSPAEALRAVAHYLGISPDDGTDPPPPAPPPPPTQAPRRDDDQAAAALAKLKARWDQAAAAPRENGYLVSKGVDQAAAVAVLRVDSAGWLLAPIHRADGELVAIQAIGADGLKRFPRGSRVAGGRLELPGGDPSAPTAIVEGLATGLSVSMATGWRVVVAFSSGNLATVARAVRDQAPDGELLICGDHDTKPNGANPGRAAAVKAARAAAARPLLPPTPGDWNDYHHQHGLDALREALTAARASQADIRIFSSNSSDSSELLRYGAPSGPQLVRNSSAELEDALIRATDKGPARVIDSQAASIIAKALHDRLIWDAEAGAWLRWVGTHWQPLINSAPADKLIADAVTIGTGWLGYQLSYLTGVTGIICRRGLLPPIAWPRGVVPFLNGLLDVQTRTLRPATPQDALDWSLPHQYDPAATCPTIRAWLRSAVEDDDETCELLRAWLAALVRGITLQNFLVLIGRGGSGKGTFQRLAMALVGSQNVAVTSLRDLEENRFETAKLFGRRLALVNEAGRHGGSLNVLKAITGGDHVSLERKHVQQSGSFVFGGLVLMASNEQILSSDMTSGLERRRLMVRFPRSATIEEREDWYRRGGEEAVLHAEIPGLVNWLLELPVEEIRHRIDSPPERVAADNLLGMAAGNGVADWLMTCCIPGPVDPASPGAYQIQIGAKVEYRDSGVLRYEGAYDRAYPSYLTWCNETGRRPVSVVKFASILIDIAETLGHRIERHQHPRTRAAWLHGLRLRGEHEPAHDWVRSARASRGPARPAHRSHRDEVRL